MKKIVYILLFFGLHVFFSIHLFSQDNWIQLDNVNGPAKASSVAFSLNGLGYTVGGYDGFDYKRSMFSYDVNEDDWDKEESIGGESGSNMNRASAIAFTAHGKAYVGLGNSTVVAFFKDLWEYDPLTKIWTQKADFMGSARRQAVAFSIDEVGYVGTGQDINGNTKDFYKYDAQTNTWEKIADFGGTARRQAVGFTMGGQGYLGTGNDGILRADFWQYQPLTDTWIQKASFPSTPRMGAVGWGFFPNAYIALGYDNTSNYKNDVWEYNYFGDFWQQKNDFSGSPRAYAFVYTLNNRAYIGNGYNGGYLSDFYGYVPPLLSIEINNLNKEILTYPNPATNFFIITFKNINTFQLYSLEGKEFLNEIDIKITEEQIEVSLINIPNGMYIFKIIQKNGDIKTGKIKIENQ